MDTEDSSQFHQALLSRCQAVADSWYQAVARTSHVPLGTAEVRQRLVELTEQVIALLFRERFEHDQAQTIGASLAGLYYVEPEALGRTQEVLVRRLVEGLPADQVAALQPRLAALLGGLAAGFLQQAREITLAEQEQVRSALATALRQVQEALRRSRDELELRVKERTAELQRANEQLGREITERKRAEEALRESHSRLEETLAELRETQEQMMQQERLAAVGQLSAGIAHDFNNILASVVLYTQMSLRTSELSRTIRKRMEVIAGQADRAAELVQQILDFGRRAMIERRPLAVDSFLKEVVKLLERTLPESVQIDLSYGTDEYTVNADPTRMQQAIVTLALNARDAMPDGGELHFTLSRVEGEEINCVDCGRVVGGEWVQVEVRDSGTGIPPDVLPHIFEPFFTIRAPLGHGLGLAQLYGIVKQHEGHLEVETEVGGGRRSGSTGRPCWWLGRRPKLRYSQMRLRERGRPSWWWRTMRQCEPRWWM